MPDAKDCFQPLYNCLNKNLKLALAVSGGPDSTAMMLLAAKWAKSNGQQNSLHILTIDHGLRKDSGTDAEQVCKWAKALGLPCQILHWQHDGPTSRVQEKARSGRYQLMSKWCRNNNFDGIITAHHGDDQAETLLMRLARGSGVDGLSAMDEKSVIYGLPVYRPLLNVSSRDLRNVLEKAGHDWIKDPANHNENFERVRVRNSMPAIAQTGIDRATLTLSATRLRRARSALETMTERFINKGVTIFETGHCEINRPLFEAQPDEICIRTLTRLIMWAGGGKIAVRMAKVERLLEALDTSNKHTLSGAQLALRKTTLIIGREFGRIDPEMQKNVTLWDNRFSFTKPQNVQPYGLFINDDNHQRPPELPYFVACSLPVVTDQSGDITVAHFQGNGDDLVRLCSTPKSG